MLFHHNKLKQVSTPRDQVDPVDNLNGSHSGVAVRAQHLPSGGRGRVKPLVYLRIYADMCK